MSDIRDVSGCPHASPDSVGVAPSISLLLLEWRRP